MEEIIIKKQRQMTLSETLDFCVSSIRHRFMRSMLTLCVVILAVAFFMFLQCNNIFRNSVKGGVEQEILDSRKPSRILGMLYSPTTEPNFVKMLVDTRRTQGDVERISKVLGLNQTEMQDLVDNAYTEMIYLNFFDELTIGKRKELFGRREGRERLVFLLEPGIYESTMQKMLDFGGIRVPGGPEALKVFLDGYPKYSAVRDAAFAKWGELQKNLREAGDIQKDNAQLRQHLLNLQAQGKLSVWTDKLAKNNFILTDDEVASIIRYQDINDKTMKIQEILSSGEYRIKWRRVYGQNQYKTMDEKLERLDAKKTMGILKGAKFPSGELVTEDDLKNIAEEFRSRRNLRDLELQLDINLMKDSDGFSASQLYLMCLSFLVCVVGITNAMLMSITERFREIATLKCLGATDSFILIQIVLEALIQGVIGGLAGLIVGFIVALVNSLFQVGFRVFATFDWGMIGYAALSSLLAGILLSVLSSLYPSTKAARMAPMEAMRVE